MRILRARATSNLLGQATGDAPAAETEPWTDEDDAALHCAYATSPKPSSGRCQHN